MHLQGKKIRSQSLSKLLTAYVLHNSQSIRFLDGKHDYFFTLLHPNVDYKTYVRYNISKMVLNFFKISIEKSVK